MTDELGGQSDEGLGDELPERVSCDRCGRVHRWQLSRRGFGDWGTGAALYGVICPACVRALDAAWHQRAYRLELRDRLEARWESEAAARVDYLLASDALRRAFDRD